MRLVVCTLLFSVAAVAQEAATPHGPSFSVETAHLAVTAAISVPELTVGQEFSLVFDITPRRGMHVYAPGKHNYRVITIAVDPQGWLKIGPLEYPASEVYHFKPLDERVNVYTKPFRLVHHGTVLATPAARRAMARDETLTIRARLEYQACDDRVCYKPQSVALPLRVALKP